MNEIDTIDEAVRVLGGDTKVARWLETTQNNVANMKARGYVSRSYLLHFYMTLQDRGYTPRPGVFGLETFGRLIMPREKVRRRTKANHS